MTVGELEKILSEIKDKETPLAKMDDKGWVKRISSCHERKIIQFGIKKDDCYCLVLN